MAAVKPTKTVEGGSEDSGAPVEEYDLGYLMAPLSRQRLEMVLAKVICKYPDEVEKLIEESRKAVDVKSIEKDMKQILGSDTAVSINEALPQLEHHLKLAKDYSMAKDATNATSILSAVTKPFVAAVVDRKLVPEEGSEERGEFDEFIIMLETSWQKAIDRISAKRTVEDLTVHFKTLSQFRLALTPLLGPIFSDALRMLKKKIRKLMENEKRQEPRPNKRQKGKAEANRSIDEKSSAPSS